MAPVLHGIYRNGWHTQNQQMGITWVLVTLVLDVLGATAYAFKIPERWCKRTFDIFGASHQVFHVMVVLAALTDLADPAVAAEAKVKVKAHHQGCGYTGFGPTVCFQQDGRRRYQRCRKFWLHDKKSPPHTWASEEGRSGGMSEVWNIAPKSRSPTGQLATSQDVECERCAEDVAVKLVAQKTSVWRLAVLTRPHFTKIRFSTS
ncbi:hypothetical protein IFR05_015887 [Cadophora sp. M221]|nr:hypothetical protein IFR05_015887 [Cadophora sp. M221]